MQSSISSQKQESFTFHTLVSSGRFNDWSSLFSPLISKGKESGSSNDSTLSFSPLDPKGKWGWRYCSEGRGLCSECRGLCSECSGSCSEGGGGGGRRCSWKFCHYFFRPEFPKIAKKLIIAKKMWRIIDNFLKIKYTFLQKFFERIFSQCSRYFLMNLT